MNHLDLFYRILFVFISKSCFKFLISPTIFLNFIFKFFLLELRNTESIMFSFPMLLPFFCLLFFFVGQMPSMIAGMPAEIVASLSVSASNSKSQFSDTCQIIDDVFNFSRNNNKSRAIFDKILNFNEEMKKCCQQGGGECKNETLIKEGNKLMDPLFDVFDNNKDDQLDVEEIVKIIIDGAVYVMEKTCIEKGTIFEDPKNPKKLTEWERKLLTEKMKKEVLPEIEKGAKERAAKMVEEDDKNGDGKLSKEEMEESNKNELFGNNGEVQSDLAPMTMGAHNGKFD